MNRNTQAIKDSLNALRNQMPKNKFVIIVDEIKPGQSGVDFGNGKSQGVWTSSIPFNTLNSNFDNNNNHFDEYEIVE
jgi:hypothetical protein